MSARDPFVVDAIGVRWLLDVDGLEPALGARLRTLWSRARVADGGPGVDGPPQPFVLRRVDESVLVQDDAYEVDDDALPYAVSRALTIASIGRRLGSCLLLHAAGVAAPDGRTLALVAPSGTGKTTAARTLGRSFGYVSDETVAVEDDLRVRAYPKPLSVVVDPASPHDKEESAPDELGLRPAPDGLRLAGVVVLDRDPSAGAPTLTPAGLVEASVAVVPQSSALLRMADPVESLATALTVGGGPWRLTYAEIGDCRELLEELLDGRVVGPERSWTAERGPEASASADALPTPRPAGIEVGGLTSTDRVRRTSWQHALHAEGSSLVLAGSLPLGLPGLASTVWRAADAWRTVDELVEAAVVAHGAHPDAAGVVDATVRELLGTGAVELEDRQVV